MKEDVTFSSRIYVAGFVVCPVLFYLPKFFEIRTVTGLMTFNQTIDCSSLVFPRGDQVLAVEPSSRYVHAQSVKNASKEVEAIETLL